MTTQRHTTTLYVQLAHRGKDHVLRSDEKRTLCGKSVSTWAIENSRLFAAFPVCWSCDDVRHRATKAAGR